MKIIKKEFIDDNRHYYDLTIDGTHNFCLADGEVVHNCGVGFSVQNFHVEKLPDIKKPNPNKTSRYLINDSIEGWADAIKMLLKSYFNGSNTIRFDYSDIRPKGARLITSGGKAPGPQPLKDCIHHITKILNDKETGDKLAPIDCHDIICHIADAVLAGGVRRAALISLFNADDIEMLNAKIGNWWELNPQRGRANNSAVLLRHKITQEFFLDIWKRVELSGAGEPGVYFSTDKDWGSNPCVEIALRPFQFCNLCEINASNIESEEDFAERVKAATLIGTLQATYTDFHYLRPIWQKTTEKDALIGISMTGIASNVIFNYDLEKMSKLVVSENKRLAKILGIKSAARTTCVKPSGCMTPSTEIWTSKGTLTLEEIFNMNGYSLEDYQDVNDIFLPATEDVYVRDNADSWQLITQLYVNGTASTLDIELEDGLVVTVTPNHRFLTEGRGWVRADELVVTDILVDFSNQ